MKMSSIKSGIELTTSNIARKKVSIFVGGAVAM